MVRTALQLDSIHIERRWHACTLCGMATIVPVPHPTPLPTPESMLGGISEVTLFVTRNTYYQILKIFVPIVRGKVPCAHVA